MISHFCSCFVISSSITINILSKYFQRMKPQLLFKTTFCKKNHSIFISFICFETTIFKKNINLHYQNSSRLERLKKQNFRISFINKTSKIKSNFNFSCFALKRMRISVYFIQSYIFVDSYICVA